MVKALDDEALNQAVSGQASASVSETAAAARHSYKKLTDDQIFLLRDTFQIFDQDGSGTIETAELQSVLGAMGMNLSTAEIEDMISEVDGDGSGSINFPEFVLMMADRMHEKDKVPSERLDCRCCEWLCVGDHRDAKSTQGLRSRPNRADRGQEVRGGDAHDGR